MLRIDESYQRSLDGSASQALIRKIAQHWNWDLCQPLVVSRRAQDLFVIDGQHRLAAARLRKDIQQLPCVIVEYESAADEAASFVQLNQQRRPLSKLDLFKAAIASEDEEALAIAAAMTCAGLSIAAHGNFIAWKPGMVSNIGGIEAAWRTHGAEISIAAMTVMARSYADTVLRYAGTIYPGIAALVAETFEHDDVAVAWLADPLAARLVRLIASRSQTGWRSEINRLRADDPNLKYSAASKKALLDAWLAEDRGEKPASRAQVSAITDIGPNERVWCSQCERQVSGGVVTSCTDPFCQYRGAA